jgi:uncharacterized protein (DUF488 family)
MTMQIYTCGYGRQHPDQIFATLKKLGAVLVDIRYTPWGRPGFKSFELSRALGAGYIHVKALGNAEYKTGGMRIADYDAGRAILAGLDHPALLMCACASPDGCHRTVVGRLLQRDGFVVVELEPGQPQQPTLW